MLIENILLQVAYKYNIVQIDFKKTKEVCKMLNEKDILKTLGKRLRILRELHELKQQDLAKKLFISQAILARYEAGVIRPPVETLVRIADYFDVTVDFLLGRDNSSKHNELDILLTLQKQKEENEITKEIKEMIANYPDPEELKFLFRQYKKLSPKSIKKLIQIINAIEEEEHNNE